MNTIKMRASAAASVLALATMIGLAAAPSATAATTAAETTTAAVTAESTAQLAIDAPLWIRNAEGNNQIWFGSLQVKSGDTTTCLTQSDFSDTVIVGGRLRLTTDFPVTLGTSYELSAWESNLCDAYVPSWGTRTRTLGGVTATPTADTVSDGVWRVTIP